MFNNFFFFYFYFFQYWWMSPNAYYMFYCSMGIIIFGIYIIIDIIMIVGGKRFEISYDDYIFAALILYIDIIRLFLYILAMLGRK
jgi:protein lifeguard